MTARKLRVPMTAQSMSPLIYVSTHPFFYSIHHELKWKEPSFAIIIKTPVSVGWHEPTAVRLSKTGRILLQKNRQKENLWNHMCGINGMFKCFLFYDGKRADFHLRTAEGCGIWLTGLTGRENTKTIHSSIRTSFPFAHFSRSICSELLNTSVCQSSVHVQRRCFTLQPSYCH